MTRKHLLFGSLLACTALALGPRIFARPILAKPEHGDSAYDIIDASIEAQLQRMAMPGAMLAIVEGDQIVHMRGFGQAHSDGTAPTPQTPFFIGSLTKSVTALAVMQLVEAGRLDPDAPVQRYMPWFRVADAEASARITVRHLLYQTSGLPTSAGEIQMADFDARPDAAERQARVLATQVLAHPIGETFEYSNANFNLLGLIVAAASGEPYADYVQRHIFAPLAMTHSFTTPDAARQHRLAQGHQYWFTVPIAAPDVPFPHGSLASGQLIASAEDMAHYMIALLNGGHYGDAQILSPEGITELHRGEVEVREMGMAFGKYGMGWFVDAIGEAKLLWHSGTTPNFGAYMALLPEQRKGVILLFNANHHWMTPEISSFGAGVAALLADEQPPQIPFAALLPWLLRGQLLIPAFLLVDIAATLRLVRRWRGDPARQPSGWGVWGWGLLLPLLPNLLIAATLLPLLGATRGYLRLYMPDYALIGTVCGSFALAWIPLRTGLLLHALRAPQRSCLGLRG